jgi:hypothetical protein
MTKFHHGQDVWVHELSLQPAKFDKYPLENANELMLINFNGGKHFTYGNLVNSSRVTASKHEAIDVMIAKLEKLKEDLN